MRKDEDVVIGLNGGWRRETPCYPSGVCTPREDDKNNNAVIYGM
jgi:hypothetical protein